MKKLIIFDCDGVLVNSEIVANRIEAEEFSKLGFPITTEEHIRLFTGSDAVMVNKIITEKIGMIPTKEFFSKTQVAVYQAFEIELTPLISSVLQFVTANNIANCIASNSHAERIVKALTVTKQLEFFKQENIFVAAQVPQGKPAPDLFLFAARQMKFDVQDCLVIEDSAMGIQAALAANIEVIGFLGGDHAKYDWYQQRINAYNIPIAHDVTELLGMIRDRCI